jgi:hypothetical protein
VYDFGLLALAVIHGFNGLRYIVTDYAKNETVKRGLVYLCVILAVVLLVSGGGALFLSINERAIQTASEALAELQALHSRHEGYGYDSHMYDAIIVGAAGGA